MGFKTTLLSLPKRECLEYWWRALSARGSLLFWFVNILFKKNVLICFTIVFVLNHVKPT